MSVNFHGLTRAVKKGDPILLGDGEIELEATQVGKHRGNCKIIFGGILGSHKGIHFPHGSLNVRALTTRDKKDLAFGIEQKVDMVALSFVRTSGDILYARRELQTRGSTIPLIAKMEKHEAVDHIDAILEIVDGIMVARGDLGLEIAQESIPTVQKMMIRKANTSANRSSRRRRCFAPWLEPAPHARGSDGHRQRGPRRHRRVDAIGGDRRRRIPR